MINILKKFCEDNSLVSIYTNKNDYDKFSVGYILSVTEEYILIEHLNMRGEFDGHSVRETNSVYRVEQGGMYLEKIAKLNRAKEVINKTHAIITQGNVLINTIKYAIKNKLMANICIDENSTDITGYIIDFFENHIKVLQISEYGKSDSETFFSINEIIKIWINDTECMDLDILYRCNKTGDGYELTQ